MLGLRITKCPEHPKPILDPLANSELLAIVIRGRLIDLQCVQPDAVSRLGNHIHPVVCSRHADMQYKGFSDQFKQQNTYNDAIQQNMETLARDYLRVVALEDKMAAFRKELDELSRARNGPTTQRKGGRPRREL